MIVCWTRRSLYRVDTLGMVHEWKRIQEASYAEKGRGLYENMCGCSSTTVRVAKSVTPNVCFKYARFKDYPQQVNVYVCGCVCVCMFLRVCEICENQPKKDLNVKLRTTFDGSTRCARCVIRNVFNFIVDKFVYGLFPPVPK